MRRIAGCICVFGAVASALAVDSLVRLDLETGRVSVLGSTAIYTLEGVFGTRADVTLSGFGGFRVSESGEILGGLAVTTPLRVARNLSVDIGGAVTFEQGRRARFGIVLSWRS